MALGNVSPPSGVGNIGICTFDISSDNGVTWTQAFAPLNNGYGWSVYWDGTNFLVAGQDFPGGNPTGVIWKSTNGTTWTRIVPSGVLAATVYTDIQKQGSTWAAVGQVGGTSVSYVYTTDSTLATWNQATVPGTVGVEYLPSK